MWTPNICSEKKSLDFIVTLFFTVPLSTLNIYDINKIKHTIYFNKNL